LSCAGVYILKPGGYVVVLPHNTVKFEQNGPECRF
jgi:hypothetical protein